MLQYKSSSQGEIIIKKFVKGTMNRYGDSEFQKGVITIFLGSSEWKITDCQF